MRRSLPGESRKLSNYIRPMLAKETDTPFDDEEWIFEIKWDGYRAIAEVKKSEVRLYSRNGNLFNASYPVIVAELQKMKISAVLDGEVVALDKDENPNFQLLQDYGHSSATLVYYVFDLLALQGKDTCNLSLLERKKLLKKLLPPSSIIRYSDHIREAGKPFFAEMKKRNLEGMMAKKADSEYFPGRRSCEWLKVKQHKTQEAIIAGFTEPKGGRKYFGALVLAVREGNVLKYIGHTGSGFDQHGLRELSEQMKPFVRSDSPFEEKIDTNMPVTWVEPTLVCEIKFTEWTREGSMRHPIFMHLRPDKKPAEVMIDKKMKTPNKARLTHFKYSKPGARKMAAGKKNNSENESDTILAGKTEVTVTHSDKMFWPEEKITKGDVLGYYQRVASYILPYLKGRPESLKRNPNGILDKGFYQKDAGANAPAWVETKKIFSESAQKDIDYIICNSEATLAYLNNLGCVELNPWHSTVKNLENPDYLIIDIDPSAGNTFDQVIESALVIHELLERAKAPCFCKTSGASGMHIYVPTARKYTYDQLKDFAQLICLMTKDQLPGFTTLERNLQKRGKKHIYLDHLQNRRGQTIASAYSLRPYPGATVSTPLHWKEVKRSLDPSIFNIHTIEKRLNKTGDLFAGIFGKGIDLSRCLKLLDK
jgi:bifunctional non-homologous end joining protein LigD